jgi:hypothetical protein
MILKNSPETIQPNIITPGLILNIFYTADKLSVLYKEAGFVKINFEFEIMAKSFKS